MQSALKEIDNLRIHIQKGCFSGIKPGRGTNRNEELHKDLNKIFSSSRYGVELAFAMFTTCFYRHNEKISARGNKRPEYQVNEYKHHLEDQTVGVCALMQETDYDYVTIHSVMFYL